MPTEKLRRQPYFASLGNKLTVLVLATVLATLVLMGGSFWWLMGSFHETQARSKISEAARALQFELNQVSTALEEAAHRLAKQSDVISSVNLIHAYEDPENYQPLVFDPEKRALAQRLNQAAFSSNFDLIATYTPDGRLTAFSINHNNHASPGYQTYLPDGESRFILVSESERNNPMLQFAPQPYLFLSNSGIEPAMRAGRIINHSVPRGLMMDIITPILRTRANDNVQNLGWLRATSILDDAFFSNLGTHAGVHVSLDQPQSTAPHANANIPTLSLNLSSAPAFAWSQSGDAFSAAMQLQDAQGGATVLKLSINKEELVAGLTAFRDAAIVVMVLALFVFVPAMLIFVRTNITRPLNALVDSALRIKDGARVTPAGTHRKDEIGALAKAFDVMSETVQSREHELYEKQGLLDGMVNNAPSLIQVKDIAGRYIIVNNRWEKFFGLTLAEVRGKTARELLPAATAAAIHMHDDQVRLSRAAHQFEEDLNGADGTTTFIATRFPLLNEQGDVYAVCGISQDISERKQAEERLRLTQRVVDETVEGIIITNADTVIVDVNPAFSQITGYSRDEVIGHKPSLMSSGRHDKLFYKEMWNQLLHTGQWTGEIWDRRRNGDIYPKWLSISAIYDELNQVSNYVGVFSDISQVKETERKLEHMAHYDALTGLPNRILFQDRLRRALARHRRHGQTGALLFIDLDRFKQVNDTLGHEKGDDLLIEATARLLDCVREEDTVARLGGDEFTVVLNELEDANRARDVAERIIHRLEDPFKLSGNEAFISASIGIVLFPADGDNIETLTRNADMAMYEAKNQGRARFTFFNESMNARILERMTLETGLRAASLNDELRLYFQPKYDIHQGRIVSTEALVRWMHPERGLLSPDLFIPLAEETGLILDIGRWVMFEACRQTRQWIDDHGISLAVAINISARQFADPFLAEDLARAMKQYTLDPSMVSIEITESMIMDDVNRAVAVLKGLKRLGLHISIDDFGTGYSSLNQLRRLPVDELKIDRTFVSDIPDSAGDMEIVTAVLAMAKSLNLSVVAEGVETLEQFEFLRDQGCTQAQGYLIGRPVDGETLPLYLRDDGPNADVMAQLESSTRNNSRILQ
ncbi:MAG TPA: EAL domain-containing protein [Magnetovibrio sp.]